LDISLWSAVCNSLHANLYNLHGSVSSYDIQTGNYMVLFNNHTENTDLAFTTKCAVNF